jgi:hypothetical protein
LNEHGNYPHLARQRSCDFQSDRVIGVFEPAYPAILGHQPVPANDRQQHIAGGDSFLDRLDEVLTSLHPIHILEQLPLSERLVQRVKKPPDVTSGLLAALTDQNITCQLMICPQDHWYSSAKSRES